MEKQCSRCRYIRPLETFSKDCTKKDGLSIYCKSCRKAYKENWDNANRDKILDYNTNYAAKGIKKPREWSNKGAINKKYIKESKGLQGKCDHCGYSKYTEVLQYHHKDPSTKSFEIAHVGARDLELLKLEISKCLLLCPTCHAEEHLGGKNKKNSIKYLGKY